tara:strand:- start:1414 stop:2247 length:834 start_codon:yes stop_codon:yes gene_type:complete
VITTFFSSSGLTSFKEASDESSIPSSSISLNSSIPNSAYGIWIYVDDWNYGYGKEKVVFRRVNGDGQGLRVHLGSHTNDLKIITNYKSDGTSVSGNSDGTSSSGTTTDYDLQQRILDSHADLGHYHDASGNAQSGSNPDAFTGIFESSIKEGVTNNLLEHSCTIKNIPLQKFCHIILSYNDKALDVYLNGKLVKTCLIPGVPFIDSDADVKVTPKGESYSGYSSKFKFWPAPMDPQKAWDNYSDGYSTGLGFSNFFAKYKLKVALLENNVEEGSITF